MKQTRMLMQYFIRSCPGAAQFGLTEVRRLPLIVGALGSTLHFAFASMIEEWLRGVSPTSRNLNTAFQGGSHANITSRRWSPASQTLDYF